MYGSLLPRARYAKISASRGVRELSHVGVDGLFGKPKEFLKPVKTAPFYFFEYLPSAWSTNGGVKVDSHLRAMDKDNVAIPGLYVAGVDQESSYCVPYYSNPGSSVAIRSVQGHRPHAVLMPLDGLCRISRLQSQDRRVAIRACWRSCFPINRRAAGESAQEGVCSMRGMQRSFDRGF